MSTIVIIGGGITGTAAAEALSREGHAVTLIEKHGIAAMASGARWAACGNPGAIRRNCRSPSAAVALWAGLSDALGADVDYRRGGNLRLARTAAEVDVIRALVKASERKDWISHFLPDNAAVRAIAPALSPHVSRRVVLPHGRARRPGQGDAGVRRLLHGVMARTFREGVAATRDPGRQRPRHRRRHDGRLIPAERVILAAGIHTPALLAPLGLDLPLSIQSGLGRADRNRCRLRSRRSSASPMPIAPAARKSTVACASPTAARRAAPGRTAIVAAVRDVVALVAHVLPIASRAKVSRTWTGLIDLTPDGLPVIDAPESVAGLVVAAGFSGHGFCLGRSPASCARILPSAARRATTCRVPAGPLCAGHRRRNTPGIARIGCIFPAPAVTMRRQPSGGRQ